MQPGQQNPENGWERGEGEGEGGGRGGGGRVGVEVE